VRIAARPQLRAEGYQRHPLHQGERAWPETNCYADLWIELIHALDMEPLAGLGFTLEVDFEGDQWTFFKPSHAELFALYGIDVQELNLWRPLLDHVAEQLARGRIVLAEVDAFFLPDTAGTDYRQQHTKTTVGIQSLDVEAQLLEYFHNAGYFSLSGEDFAGLFARASTGAQLPPYVEFAKLDLGSPLSPKALAQKARALLPAHLARAPRKYPVTAFAPRFLGDLQDLQEGVLPDYHLYAFATLRQLGAAFELAAHHLRWLEQQGEKQLEASAIDFETISTTSKAMILKTARAVATKKSVDFQPLLQTLSERWEAGMQRLRSRYAP
jgi:hypothetical protein